jgi:hypothetical protein
VGSKAHRRVQAKESVVQFMDVQVCTRDVGALASVLLGADLGLLAAKMAVVSLLLPDSQSTSFLDISSVGLAFSCVGEITVSMT